MPKFMTDYIRLCHECNFDVATLWNMRSIVIPNLQREADELRLAVETVPAVFLCRQILEGDAAVLESAVRAGLQRCMSQPVQRELFTA